MSFDSAAGNPQRNLYLDRELAGSEPGRLEAIVAPKFNGEGVRFVHEAGDRLCLHYAEGVQIYAPGFSSSWLIGNLPSGPASLFLPDGAWASHTGPLRKYGPDFRPVAEGYFVPHGGPWTKCLGIFRTPAGIVLAFAFSGGPRVWAPQLDLLLIAESPDGAAPAALEQRAAAAHAGYVDSLVQLGGILYAAGEKGLTLLNPDGTIRKEIALSKGLRNLSACKESGTVGGFTQDADGRWIYREYEAGGTEILSYTLAGARTPGRVVFAPDGSRFLMSDQRLVKLKPNGDRSWSQALLASHEQAPNLLAFKNGCAFVDGGELVVLDEQGNIRFRVPLAGKRIGSPPYLDAAGRLWLGLSNEVESLLKLEFKP